MADFWLFCAGLAQRALERQKPQNFVKNISLTKFCDVKTPFRVAIFGAFLPP